MVSIQSLGEARTEIMAAARVDSSDTVFQGFVDRWMNQKMAEYAEFYWFPEMMTRWRGPLSSTAPTPHVWAPYELNAVPRDLMDVLEAEIIDTEPTETQGKYRLQVLPQVEFHRMITVVNPPASSRPSAMCIRRREGTREQLFDPRTGDTGIRVTSTATEDATLTCAVTYYADANRVDIRKVITSTQITASATTMVSGTHYGIVSVSISANASGRITIDNTAGTNVYALLQPWEREATYPVLAFNSLPTVTTDVLHLLYKRWPQYLSQAADVMHGFPVQAQKAIVQHVKAMALRHQEDSDWKDEFAAATATERDLIVYRPHELEEPHVVMDDFD